MILLNATEPGCVGQGSETAPTGTLRRSFLAACWAWLLYSGVAGLTLKTPYRDGTTHIVMSPLEFMQRLAALVPRPRLNLAHFHGVLEPNSKLTPKIISGEKKGKSSPSDASDDAQYPLVSVRISWARLLKWVFDIDIDQCPHCGGSLKIIATILESSAITKIIDHLGLPARASPRAPAKSTIFSSQPGPVLAP